MKPRTTSTLCQAGACLKIQTNFVLTDPRMGSFPDSARNFDYHSGTGVRRSRQDVTTKGDKRPWAIGRAGEKRSHLICRLVEGCSTLNACKTGPFPIKIAPFSFLASSAFLFLKLLIVIGCYGRRTRALGL
jgi:hypothetical protein